MILGPGAFKDYEDCNSVGGRGVLKGCQNFMFTNTIEQLC